MSSGKPPEFFFDRSLGKITAARLREAGYVVHGGNLTIREMSAVWLDALPRVLRAVRAQPTGFWHVYRDGTIRQMWPQR